MRASLEGARVLALGAFLAAAALAAYGGEASKPDLGAGPHQDFRPMEGGNGESLRPGSPEPKFPKPAPEAPQGAPAKSGASSGSSAKPSDTQSPEDERRATERKEKAKKRPGYREEAPSPRASRGGPGGRVN